MRTEERGFRARLEDQFGWQFRILIIISSKLFLIFSTSIAKTRLSGLKRNVSAPEGTFELFEYMQAAVATYTAAADRKNSAGHGQIFL